MDLLETLVVARTGDIGGFAVRRALPSVKRRMVGPFVFLDQMGPAEFIIGHGLDVRPHPHIGLATVTYLFEGEILHRDSLGTVQPIQPGAVNWMTAGRGISHSERTAPELRARGFNLFGIQSWVALPAHAEEADPAFVHHPVDDLPVIEGEGKATYANGMVYEGGFRNARNHGQGRMTYPDGYVYTGAWADGQRHGEGQATYADGTVYTGGFVNGLREGQGKLTTPDGFIYEGGWKAGEIDGKGTATYASGDRYEGSFVAGKRQGQGVMRYASGEVASGQWDQNRLVESGPAPESEATDTPAMPTEAPNP